MEIPQIVRDVRRSLGETQAEFGRRLGVTETSVLKYESGEYSPKASILDAVADICQDLRAKEVLLERSASKRAHIRQIRARQAQERLGRGSSRHPSKTDKILSELAEIKQMLWLLLDK